MYTHVYLCIHTQYIYVLFLLFCRCLAAINCLRFINHSGWVSASRGEGGPKGSNTKTCHKHSRLNIFPGAGVEVLLVQ